MKERKYDFQTKDFLYGGIITVIIGVIALVSVIIGLNVDCFDPVGQAIRNYRISDGFFYTNSTKASASQEVNPGIVLVDIKECDSRKEIAEIVRKVNDASPKLLAVDIIFGKAATFSAEEDSELMSAFQGSPNLILALRYVQGADGWHAERSFFANDVECVEGDVYFDNGVIRDFSPSLNAGGVEVPTFISLVARIGGISEGYRTQLINYSPVTTICVGPDQLTSPDILKNQIVILGDTEDLRDFHDIPVLIDGQARISGLKIIAQCLYTLRPHNGFVKCPEWLSMVIGILLTYLFCTFIASPMFRIEKFNGFWITIWQVIVLIILLILTFILFWGFHFSFSLTYWLVGVGLSELATEFFYFITGKK